jgi:hypothetical protein
MDEQMLYATVWLGADAEMWSPSESTLIRACDELHAAANLTDETWSKAAGRRAAALTTITRR